MQVRYKFRAKALNDRDMRRKFRIADRDRSGGLDKREFRTVIRKLIKLTDKQCVAVGAAVFGPDHTYFPTAADQAVFRGD